MSKTSKTGAIISQKAMNELFEIVRSEEKEKEFLERIGGMKIVLSYEGDRDSILYKVGKTKFKTMQKFFNQDSFTDKHRIATSFVAANPDDIYDPDL